MRRWSKTLSIPVTTITVRRMRRKWASASTSGNLTFNVELLGHDREVQDYVIVHELLHLAVPNHGPLWKSLMRAHLGEWEVVAERLRETRD